MRALITGGAGFIGSHVADRLLASGAEVLVIDNYSTGRRDNLVPRAGLHIVEGSIADVDLVQRTFAGFRPDVILHAAASYKDPGAWTEDSATNVVGTANVVRAAQDASVRRLVYLQTALCYGIKPLEQPITLAHPLHPEETSYAISKTAGEHYVRISGLDWVSFRLANAYGPRNLSGPLPTFFHRLTTGKPCFVMDTRRDFVYVDDLVDIVLKSLDGDGASGVYHVSSGSDHSIKELFDDVVDTLGVSLASPVEVRPRGPDDAYTILLDPTRTNEEFGWRTKTPLAQGVKAAVSYYRAFGITETYTHLRIGSRPDVTGAKVLVVGGAGFVGSNLVCELLDGGVDHLMVIDNLLSSERNSVPESSRVTFLEGSVADDDVLAEIPGDVEQVFHLATFHGNQNSIANPLADHDNNLITTLKLYERLRSCSALRKVVYAASGCTLAPHTHDPAEPVLEDGPVPLELDSPYQISKVVGEFHSVYYHKQHGLPTVRARFQNVYGPGETLGAGKWRGTAATVWRNVVPTFVYRAITGLPLVLDDGGRASRDFIYVGDIVEGLLRCAASGTPGGVYNLASGEETTILALATLVVELAESRSTIEVGPSRSWDRSGRRVGSTEKSHRELGFEALTDLRDGLRRTISWTRANLPAVEACIGRHEPHLSRVALTPATSR